MFTHDEIERIKNYQATEDTILSVYLNLGPDIREGRSVRARLVDLLKPILGSTERMEHDRAEALRADVQTVMSMEERIQADRGHGVALFSCHATGFFGYLSLPAGVWDAATAGPSPYIRPLMAVLEAYPKMVAVVVDRKRSDLFAFSMAGVEAHEEVVSDVLRSKHFGGWYGLEEYRTQHRAVELAHHHYKDTVTRLEELFHRFGADVLCVGGHNDTTDEFLPFLPAHLADRLIGTFHVDPHTMTASIVRDRCADLRLVHVAREHERDVELLVQTTERGGLAVLGLARTLDAVNAGAVSTLLVDGGGEVPGYVCDRCHWLGIEGDTCPVCGTTARATTYLIDEIIDRTVADGGTFTQIGEETALRGHRLGAMLRFPVALLLPAEQPSAERMPSEALRRR